MEKAKRTFKSVGAWVAKKVADALFDPVKPWIIATALGGLPILTALNRRGVQFFLSTHQVYGWAIIAGASGLLLLAFGLVREVIKLRRTKIRRQMTKRYGALWQILLAPGSAMPASRSAAALKALVTGPFCPSCRTNVEEADTLPPRCTNPECKHEFHDKPGIPTALAREELLLEQSKRARQTEVWDVK